MLRLEVLPEHRLDRRGDVLLDQDRRIDLVDVLPIVEAGLPVENQFNRGRGPADFARGKGREEIGRLLDEGGAAIIEEGAVEHRLEGDREDAGIGEMGRGDRHRRSVGDPISFEEGGGRIEPALQFEEGRHHFLRLGGIGDLRFGEHLVQDEVVRGGRVLEVVEIRERGAEFLPVVGRGDRLALIVRGDLVRAEPSAGIRRRCAGCSCRSLARR